MQSFKKRCVKMLVSELISGFGVSHGFHLNSLSLKISISGLFLLRLSLSSSRSVSFVSYFLCPPLSLTRTHTLQLDPAAFPR